MRDRKRAECYQRWLELARDDDFLGVQNYARVPYDANGVVHPPEGAEVNQMRTEIEPLSLAGAVRYAHSVAGVPILVTEHGMATPTTASARRSSSPRCADCSTRWTKASRSSATRTGR